MAEVVFVSSEDELWTLLEGLLSDSGTDKLGAVQVKGWQPPLLYFPEEPIGHSVTPAMARAVTGFHNSLSRAYAFLAYGQANARLLHRDDDKVLNLRIIALDGSDKLEIFGEDLGRLVGGMLSKMSGNQVTMAVVLFLLLYFGQSVTANWIHDRYETKRQDIESRERISASDQETKRLQLVTEAFNKNPNLKPMADLSEQGKESLVRGVANVDHAEIQGVLLLESRPG